MASAAAFKLTGIPKEPLLTLGSDSRGPKVGYEARGAGRTKIDMDGGKRGSQERGRVGDSFNGALIYAGCIPGCGVGEAGEDKFRSNSVDTQAPGISRRLLPSSEAMV